ncbi:MAG TPA: hypothetical protein VMN56_19535 [Casimicrobiaceae bacterium]|nr:hypothetical protein [Casimicrobiaceae bacterium]
MPTKPIQMILARQLASSLATPIFLMDAEGTLIYFNEGAEILLNQRFEETGEIPADEYAKMVEVADEHRNPVPPERWPTRVARLQRQPVSQTIWTRSRNGQWRHLQVTIIPIVGEGDAMHGVMNIFWEL